ncbi:aminoglycoside 6'-N-acetyltransferase [Anaerococcus sp. Marseille-Q5996]|uniref:aminoglycoside 6'-N-acetyltransferase n=1 Tax=Anaerococcus sp. Marseille-Q5996 TaxID=2972769 RepID=UPI0021C72530|nr:aminoglycoside 6'-N-acetyltransferase [Anaerococcus sp. Marseille-Q5996]
MILKASLNDSRILAQMAIKIWDNDSVEELEQEFNEFAVNSDMASFIKYVDKKPVGFSNVSIRYDYVEGCETSPVGYLEGIYVEDCYRNNNFARDLVEACEVWVKSKGIKEFASDCELTNLDSLAFHLAIGFSEANRIICFKKDI